MRLERGLRLPDFDLHDLAGEQIALQSYASRHRWLILSRFAGCPFCSLRLRAVAARQPELARLGVEILVVFPSPEGRVRKYVERYDPTFRVAADPDQVMFRALGAETSWAGELRSAVNLPRVMQALVKTRMNPLAMDGPIHRMPSEYLIDPDETIAHVHYGQELDDGFPHPEVMAWATERSDR